MLRRTWYPLLVAVSFFAFAAGGAQATTYVKGFVRPSGDGAACTSDPTNNCVQLDTSVTSAGIPVVGGAVNVLQAYDVLTFSIGGTGASFNTIDALPLNLLGIQPGDTITFEFTTLPDASTAGGTSTSTFGLLGCDTNTTINGTNIGAIFNSINPGTTSSIVTTYCTNSTDANLVGDGTSGITNGNPSVSFSFGSGAIIPTQLAFAFPDSFSNGTNAGTFVPLEIDITGPTDGTGGGTATPEPASLTLVAAGLLGLGALRRKRAA